MTWKLKRTSQCDKCPWKVSTDPKDIPDGYDVKKHRDLARTISSGIESFNNNHVMACHETGDTHCIGWLVNQMGEGNNIGLRYQMISCSNAKHIKVFGEQHKTFEETIK